MCVNAKPHRVPFQRPSKITLETETMTETAAAAGTTVTKKGIAGAAATAGKVEDPARGVGAGDS